MCQLARLLASFLILSLAPSVLAMARGQNIGDEVVWMVQTLQFGGRRFTMASGAMEPTLQRQSITVWPRVDPTVDPPRHGDIVLFTRTAREFWFFRVIGLPGDVISMEAGELSVNGTPLPRQPIPTPPSFLDFGRGAVPQCFEETNAGRSYAICWQSSPPPPRFINHMAPRTVPHDHVFLMGDNRSNSLDSRFNDVGFVPIISIIARDPWREGDPDRTRLR